MKINLASHHIHLLRASVWLWMALLPLGGWAQKTNEQLGGVYYAYPSAVASEWQLPTLPAGYQPVYVSHYGRHGSRWLPSEDRYEWVMEHFENKKNLTKTGLRLRRQLQKVWKNARGNAGKLTPLGARQHEGIAQRMKMRLPEIFDGAGHIDARSSTSGRCQKSMIAFTQRLKALNESLDISTTTREEDMRFINYNSKEQKALEAKTICPPRLSPDRFLTSLFKDPSVVEQPLKLLSELHTIATDMQDVELDIDLFPYFTRDEMEAVYESNNRRMSICNGAGIENDGIPARCAVTLWERIVEDAEAALSGINNGTDPQKRTLASLRFGHDTSLYRLLSLLQIDTSEMGMDEIIPMAANLQLIFYRNSEGDVAVVALHNEQAVQLPVEELAPKVYRWTDVKTYYTQRIHQLEHLQQLVALNTMVGTAAANTQTAGLFGKGSEEHGQTLPAVLAPNGQNFWTPQTQETEKKCVAPYYYKDTLWHGIRNSHWIVGGCTQDYGSFTLGVVGGKLRTQTAQRATPFSHADEISHPHYYAVELPEEALRVELTASSHCAKIRITPHKTQPIHLLLDCNSDEAEGNVRIDTLGRIIYGENPVHRIYQGWGERAGFSGHIALLYTEELVDFGTYNAQQTTAGALSATHEAGLGAYLTFEGKAEEPFEVTLASSFCDEDGCLNNMEGEINDLNFNELQQILANDWIDRLHRIDVESDDTAAVNQFYGALYRTSFLPREFSDIDGRCPTFASAQGVSIREEQPTKRYMDFSMWDTYRALHPLYCILSPSLSAAMMQSITDMYTEGGWLPVFPCWNSYTAAMIGDHCAVALADAYIKGVTDFDAQKAYEGMRKNAFEKTAENSPTYINGMGRRAQLSYLKYGYIPLEDSVKEAFHQNEQTSRTLEYAFDDFAVAQMAKALGQEQDYKQLMKRSGNWRNVINPATGYADGRRKDGSWLGNKDVVSRKSFITEGATCHYTWYVPHDPQGLIERLGGREMFVSKLDSMFTEGRYWHGNEPCHQVPYLFGYAGEAWRTQKWVRHILKTEYNDTPGGLSGNDDAGQMSAWYLLSAIGFYPVCPATPYYVIGSPTFQRVRFNLENGRTFTMEAPEASDENIYIGAATLNGVPLNDLQFSHDDLLRGGTLHFEMKNQPTKK